MAGWRGTRLVLGCCFLHPSLCPGLGDPDVSFRETPFPLQSRDLCMDSRVPQEPPSFQKPDVFAKSKQPLSPHVAKTRTGQNRVRPLSCRLSL